MSLPKRIIKVSSPRLDIYTALRLTLTLCVVWAEQETERLVADPAPGIIAEPHEDNLRYFDVVIDGPGQSPFEGE